VRTLTPVFISYDKHDRSFVKLLQKLLEHEGIESWFDRERMAAGDKHKDRVQLELEQARSLIVLVSARALDSAWMRAELEAFRMHAPSAMIIPLLLDATRAGRLDPCLEAYAPINMYDDMLAGFVDLFGRYNRDFLAQEGQRRVEVNRRVTPDRRSNPLRRLRVGLWQQLSHTTGLGKFDTIDLSRHASAKIVSALHVELAKYELYDKTRRPIDTCWALSYALAELEPQLGEIKAIYLVEKLASFLHQHFELRSRDRRGDVEPRAHNGSYHKASELSVEP
jgi:hypothetical protein